jgi:hypothetical protein
MPIFISQNTPSKTLELKPVELLVASFNCYKEKVAKLSTML